MFDGHHHRPGVCVAVRSGRIVAVAPDARSLAGPGTEVIDLAGGLLLPGFVDAHVHPLQGGLERMRCDLSGVSGRVDTLRAIKTYADTNPGADWILGGGWHQPDFPGGTPTAADLDAV